MNKVTPLERENFLLEIYDYQIEKGNSRGGQKNRKDVGEDNWRKEISIASYWEERGYIKKHLTMGFIGLQLTQQGIDYVERELL